MFRDQWWDPKALLEAAHAIRLATPEDEFVCDPAYKQVREAINAAEFASRRPWNRDWKVRPVPEADRFPDVQLRSGHDPALPFEIAEADRVTRRRCAEYRADKVARGAEPNKPRPVILFDPTPEARAARDEIARVIKQKAAKNYRPRPHLLIYVNLWSFREFEPTPLYAGQLQQLYGDKFESAWLLWQENTFRLWPKPAKIKLPPCQSIVPEHSRPTPKVPMIDHAPQWTPFCPSANTNPVGAVIVPNFMERVAPIVDETLAPPMR